MAKKPKKTCAYTVEPGRQIYHNGKPFISVGREGDTRPVDADRMTHRIARMLCAPSRCAVDRARMKQRGGHMVKAR